VTEPQPEVPGAAAPPTLDDVARLTPDSDYGAFTAPGVDPKVRNEALKKLFLSDPHFQQSDGLDVGVEEAVDVVVVVRTEMKSKKLIFLYYVTKPNINIYGVGM
jgi:hypothetical protein